MKNKLPLFGFIILIYLLYRRLLKEHLPKQIVPTDDFLIISYNMCVCAATVALACLNVYSFFKFLSKKEQSESNNLIIIKLKKIYESQRNPINLISKSLIAFDIFIKNQINNDFLDKSIMFITHYFCKYKRLFIYSFIFITLIIQSIVSISFFIDIFIMQKFYYFYKMSWLLIFPLIINYLFYSLKVFLDANFTSLEDVLTLKIAKTSDYLQKQNETNFIEITVNDWRELSKNTPPDIIICNSRLSPNYLETRPFLDQEKTLKYCIKSMDDFFIIDSFLDQYNILRNKILLPFNIIKYFLYSFCWGFLVILLIN